MIMSKVIDIPKKELSKEELMKSDIVSIQNNVTDLQSSVNSVNDMVKTIVFGGE